VGKVRRGLSGIGSVTWRLGAVLAAAFALGSCSGTGLRSVGATPDQVLAVAPPEPQAPAQEALAGPASLTPETTASVPARSAPLAIVEEPAAPAPLLETARPGGTPLKVTGAELPVQPKSTVYLPEPAMGANREAAVGEMRAKSAASGKNKPNVFAVRESVAEPVTKEEEEAMKAELAQAQARNEAGVSPEEANAKAQGSGRLLKRARSHYDEAISSIED